MSRVRNHYVVESDSGAGQQSMLLATCLLDMMNTNGTCDLSLFLRCNNTQVCGSDMLGHLGLRQPELFTNGLVIGEGPARFRYS